MRIKIYKEEPTAGWWPLWPERWYEEPVINFRVWQMVSGASEEDFKREYNMYADKHHYPKIK